MGIARTQALYLWATRRSRTGLVYQDFTGIDAPMCQDTPPGGPRDGLARAEVYYDALVAPNRFGRERRRRLPAEDRSKVRYTPARNATQNIAALIARTSRSTCRCCRRTATARPESIGEYRQGRGRPGKARTKAKGLDLTP